MTASRGEPPRREPLGGESLLREPLLPVVVLFDGDCAFCRWAIRHVVRWDRGRRGRALIGPLALQLAPGSGHPAVAAVARDLELSESLTVVEPRSGSVLRGGDAVLAVVVRLPGGGIIGPWLGVGPFRASVRLLYRAVARSRPLLARLGLSD